MQLFSFFDYLIVLAVDTAVDSNIWSLFIKTHL